MVSVKKQGRFEVFSRGVEEPWIVYRDDTPFKQAWTWPEVEKILSEDASTTSPKKARHFSETPEGKAQRSALNFDVYDPRGRWLGSGRTLEQAKSNADKSSANPVLVLEIKRSDPTTRASHIVARRVGGVWRVVS